LVGSYVKNKLKSNDIPYKVMSGVIFSNDHTAMSLPNLEVL